MIWLHLSTFQKVEQKIWLCLFSKDDLAPPIYFSKSRAKNLAPPFLKVEKVEKVEKVDKIKLIIKII
jgi:hypothetical protein